MCNPHRYEHSLRVAETARRDCGKAGTLIQILAYQAGLMHDITKAMSHEEGAAYPESTIGRNGWHYSDKIWHSYTAVIWMKQNMAYL
jgi:HD superfamily phosphohydrolase YqeK